MHITDLFAHPVHTAYTYITSTLLKIHQSFYRKTKMIFLLPDYRTNQPIFHNFLLEGNKSHYISYEQVMSIKPGNQFTLDLMETFYQFLYKLGVWVTMFKNIQVTVTFTFNNKTNP